MTEFLANPVIVVTALVWLFAETIKFAAGRLSGLPVRFTDPGGMPSVHAAVISAAAAAIALEEGTASPLFGLAVVVAAIVFHDAYRIRWASGQTAARLNELIAEGKSRVKPTVVWKGHRIREVAVGALIGAGLGAAFYLALYP